MKPTGRAEEPRAVIDVVADKWSVTLLRALDPGGSRFSDLAQLPGLSRRVLAERLRLLVQRGILRTERYQSHPVRDQYVLTERGEQLRRLLDAAAHVAAGGRLERDPFAAGAEGCVDVETGDGPDAPTPTPQHPADALLANDPAAARRIYEDSIAALVRYDHRYHTSLVTTLETWFACDMSVTVVAGQLYTHRHTIRYRLDRIRELTGHDATTSDGGEQLTLGLRARRVLAALGQLPDA